MALTRLLLPAIALVIASCSGGVERKRNAIAVRSVVHGETVKNTEALANPEALQHFRDIPELGTA